MKKLFTLMLAVLLCTASFTYAGTTTPTLKADATKKLKKDGTPDKRFKENKKPVGPLKKDGTPGMRYKTNKADTTKKAAKSAKKKA